MVEKEDLIDHLSGKSLINHILNYTSKMVKHQRHYIFIYILMDLVCFLNLCKGNVLRYVLPEFLVMNEFW